MPAKLQKLGKSISQKIEVLGISQFGVWILVKEREYLLSFNEYPWFKNATMSQIYNVQLLYQKHLHWPDLDVDLEIDSLTFPDRYPLKYK
jgi:hypothetical protein